MDLVSISLKTFFASWYQLVLLYLKSLRLIDCTGKITLLCGRLEAQQYRISLSCYPSSACSVDEVVRTSDYITFVTIEFASFSTAFLNKNEVEFADNQAEYTVTCWLFFSFIVSPNVIAFLLVNFSMRDDTIKYQKYWQP